MQVSKPYVHCWVVNDQFKKSTPPESEAAVRDFFEAAGLEVMEVDDRAAFRGVEVNEQPVFFEQARYDLPSELEGLPVKIYRNKPDYGWFLSIDPKTEDAQALAARMNQRWPGMLKRCAAVQRQVVATVKAGP